MTVSAPLSAEQPQGRRFSLPLLLILLGFVAVPFYDISVLPVMVAAIADAYLQVSTFVAGTLLIFFSAEKFLRIDLAGAISRAGVWQVPIAAALGALPGCGGAIIVVTRYVSGRLSFGSVLAALTATMGDAAFLLLAKEPLTGLFIISLGFAVGILTGYFVDFIHGPDFMRPQETATGDPHGDHEASDLSSRLLDRLWLLLFAPGLVLGLMQAFQIDVDQLINIGGRTIAASHLGFAGGMLCFGMWALPRNSIIDNSILRRTISDTNFVTSWVIFAFLLFEVSIHLTGIDLKLIFTDVAVFTPLIAVLIGFLPGCGPQILVTTLYLSGYVPLSAQIGNAISNDGDALFPAIALAPAAAITATLYSAVPALLLAYGWYIFS